MRLLTLRSQLCLLAAGAAVALALVVVYSAPSPLPLAGARPHVPPPVHSVSADGPLPETGTSNGEVLPELPSDSYMGGRWDRPVVIDDQVGEWFQPYLEAALAQWQAAGIPVQASIAYGGPAACEPGEQVPGQVVICLHAMAPPADPPDQGFTHLDVRVQNCMDPACPSQDGFVWILGTPTVLSPARLGHVLLHELGHVFGILYSPCTCSVMEIHARAGAITPSDVAALQSLYSEP